MSKIIGIMDVAVDGLQLSCGDDSTLEPGGFNRVARKGNRFAGYSEEVQESKLEVNVWIDATFNIAYFNTITASTITMTADTGQIWVINGGFCSAPPAIGQKDGKAKIVFMGPPADQVS